MSRYAEVYASWKRDPEGFWADAARDISWYKLWDKPFDPYSGAPGNQRPYAPEWGSNDFSHSLYHEMSRAASAQNPSGSRFQLA